MLRKCRIWILLFSGIMCFSSIAEETEKTQKETSPQQENSIKDNQNDKQQAKNKNKALSVYQIQSYDFIPYLELWGEVSTQASGALDVVAETTAKLQTIHPKANSNQYVEKDTILFALDDTDAKLAVTQAEANFETAKAKLSELETSKQLAQDLLPLEEQVLEISKQALERYQGLGKKNLTSNTNVENQLLSYIQAQQTVKNRSASLATLEAQIASQKSAVKGSESQYYQALRTLDKTQIKAPVSGKILNVSVQEGQMINTGSTLLRMINTDNLEVQTMIPYERFKQFFSNTTSNPQEIPANLKIGDQTWSLYLKAWPSEISTQSRQVQMNFAFKNPDDIPLLGSYGQVKMFHPNTQKAIIIPRESIQAGQVYLMDQEGKLKKVDIDAVYIGTSYALIRSGLSEGDQLVLRPPVPFVESLRYQAAENAAVIRDIQQFVAQ